MVGQWLGTVEVPQLRSLPPKTDANGNAMLPLKVWISKIPAIRFLYRSRWAQIFTKKCSKLWKKNEKNHSWADVGLRSAWEKLSQVFGFKAARFRVLDRHRSTKPTTASRNLNGARSLGAPTHPLVTVFTKRPVIGGGRRPGVWYKHIWALLCRKQATKNSRSLSDGKK